MSCSLLRFPFDASTKRISRALVLILIALCVACIIVCNITLLHHLHSLRASGILESFYNCFKVTFQNTLTPSPWRWTGFIYINLMSKYDEAVCKYRWIYCPIIAADFFKLLFYFLLYFLMRFCVIMSKGGFICLETKFLCHVLLWASVYLYVWESEH